MPYLLLQEVSCIGHAWLAWLEHDEATGVGISQGQSLNISLHNIMCYPNFAHTGVCLSYEVAAVRNVTDLHFCNYILTRST